MSFSYFTLNSKLSKPNAFVLFPIISKYSLNHSFVILISLQNFIIFIVPYHNKKTIKQISFLNYLCHIAFFLLSAKAPDLANNSLISLADN